VSSFGFLIVIVAFAVLWLVLVRPQKRRQVQQRQMLSDLRVGDEVLTAGGIYGTITRLDEHEVTVEIAPGLPVRVARRAIAGVDRPEADEDEADPPDRAESLPDLAQPTDLTQDGETVDEDRG
jgi:preprotein translocase subunit YajC